jgi:hypothetical protein
MGTKYTFTGIVQTVHGGGFGADVIGKSVSFAIAIDHSRLGNKTILGLTQPVPNSCYAVFSDHQWFCGFNPGIDPPTESSTEIYRYCEPNNIMLGIREQYIRITAIDQNPTWERKATIMQTCADGAISMTSLVQLTNIEAI